MTLTPDVAAGTIIQSAWGNEIRDRTVQTFATYTELQQWSDAPNGSLTITLDTGTIWQRAAGVWVPVVANRGAGRLGSAVITSAQTGIGTVLTPITGATVVVTPPAGRLLRAAWYCPMATADTAARTKTCTIDNGAGVNKQVDTQLHTGSPYTHNLWVQVPSTGASMTFGVRCSISGNTCNTSAGPNNPGVLLVEDIGPATPVVTALPGPPTGEPPAPAPLPSDPEPTPKEATP